jgi:hypothetical protein
MSCAQQGSPKISVSVDMMLRAYGRFCGRIGRRGGAKVWLGTLQGSVDWVLRFDMEDCVPLEYKRLYTEASHDSSVFFVRDARVTAGLASSAIAGDPRPLDDAVCVL